MPRARFSNSIYNGGGSIAIVVGIVALLAMFQAIDKAHRRHVERRYETSNTSSRKSRRGRSRNAYVRRRSWDDDYYRDDLYDYDVRNVRGSKYFDDEAPPAYRPRQPGLDRGANRRSLSRSTQRGVWEYADDDDATLVDDGYDAGIPERRRAIMPYRGRSRSRYGAP